ncbi:MAG: glycoside hydrolase family 13 protein [Pseudomonadota bacterium]
MQTTIKCALLLLVAFNVGNASELGSRTDRVQRVEPANWWVGMADQRVQVMLYGQTIAGAEVQSTHAGITVGEQHTTNNDNYLFVDLIISPEADTGRAALTITHEDGREELIDWHLYERVGKPGSGFDQSDVIYLITPDRFANGDLSNDTIEAFGDELDRQAPYGRHGGDIAGIIDRLDYIHDMGFTQIWLNPVIQNRQPQWSYHGYAITDHYQVDARFGNNKTYRELATTAHTKGMGLIMDVVLNHIGHRHWWMDDLPDANWINSNPATPAMTNHRRESLFDPYASASDRSDFTDGWFVPTMPDLNQRHPLLARYLIQNSIWWIETLGLSGLRVDTWPYSDKQFLSDYARALRHEYPNINIAGEEWTHNILITAYWQAGSNRHDSYTSYLPGTIDFALQDSIVRGLTETESWRDGLVRIYQVLANDFAYADPSKLVTFVDNHDMSRIFTQLNEDLSLYKMANGIVLTTRGIPQLYYGSEILMRNPGTDSHGIIRSDFPGGWPGDVVNGFTGEGLSPEAKDAKQFLKTLLAWRKDADAIHRGSLTHYAPANGVYVYFRSAPEQQAMIIVNKEEQQTLSLARFADDLAGATTAIDVISGEQVSLAGELTLPPQSILIYELGRETAVLQ